jgi:hypothetical protein
MPRPPARATIVAAPTTTRTEGSPAYLEATSRRNRALYERHGFVTIGELTVADCPPLYAMWRPPA